MGARMEVSQYFDDNGVKIMVVIVSLIVASSALLEGLAKLDEVKKDLVRQERWKDAATINKIVGAVATIVVACMTFGWETSGIFLIGAVLFILSPFLVFKIRGTSRAASERKIRDDAVIEEQRKAMIDALVAAEAARVARADQAAAAPTGNGGTNTSVPV